MPLNKPELLALNQENFPDNTQQLITPELLREFNGQMIGSMELTQSMDNYANLATANIFYGGNQSIAKEYKLFTNGVYWNNNTAGYNNLEIINSITGNIDIAALGGGVRIVSSSLNITNGTFTASLAEGFTYVGNGSGRTSLVSTSSFGTTINTGSFVSTSSFNAYTQSINSATASLFTSASLGLTTASFSGNTLTFTKGNGSTFGVVIPDISGSTIPSGTVSGSAQIVELGFATTASLNAYTASNNQRVDSLESNSASVNISISNINSTTASLNTSISNLNTATSSLFTSASLSLVTASFDTGNRNLTFTKGDATTFSVNIPDVSGSGIPTGTISSSAQITALGFVSSSVTASSLITASVNLNTITFTKGDASTFNITVNTGSATDISSLNAFTQSQYVSNSYFATTASLNDYTQSTNIRLNNLESTSASVNISISNLNSATSSFATSITNLNSATASLFTSASLGLVTASFSGNTLTFTKGDTSTFGVVIPDISGSTIDTGSFMTTGSVSGNILTFTKGDATTFSLTVATGSGGSTIDTGSFATTGSNTFTGNQFIGGYVKITGDDGAPNEYALETTKSIRVNQKLSTAGFTLSGSATTEAFNSYYPGTRWQHAGNVDFTNQIAGVGSGSMNITAFGGAILTLSGSQTQIAGVDFIPFSASVNGRIEALVATGSTIPAGTVSSSAQILNYNIFATTGSNNFKGSQNISSSINVGDYLGTDYVFISNNGIQLENAIQTNINFNAANNFFSAGGNFFLGNTLGGVGSGSITITANNGGNTSISGSQTNIAGIDFIPFSASLDSRILAVTGSGGTAAGTVSSSAQILAYNIFATTGSNNFKGVETIGDVAGTATGEVYLLGRSGSLILGNSVNSPTYAALSHLSSSVVNGSTNLIFKNTTFTGDTIISGSGNIFSNPFTPTTGYKRYIGGGNNLYLNSTNGINSQITASAVSVSGNRPTMNNNIFNGDTDFLINQAVNSVGTHTYSHNKIGGTNATVTINALSHTGSVNILANTVNNAVITINASSASLAEIATGRSGSGTVNVNSNFIQGGTVTNTSPLTLGTSLTQTILSNIVTGGSITVTNISSSLAVNAFNNIAIGAMSYTNAGAAGLALHRTGGSFSNNYGAMTFVASGSAITATNNISPAAMTVTNRMFSGSLGSGSLAFNNNQTQGGANTYTITGSFGGTGTPAMQANGVFGATNTIFTNVEGRGNYTSVSNNLIGGGNLILTGSNNLVLTEGGGAHFGRYNANDGRRNTTGENILSVGTGTSSARKTGFLIDSGSNSFFEGTLNVSGSTSLTGSLTIQSGSSFFANGNKQFNVGAFQSNINQSGSANVSQSMNFEVTDISSGVSIASNSQITLANSGTYNIQFSAQILADTGADDVYIWLKKNGTNVSASAGHVVLANNEELIAAWNYVVDAAASDYFELVWQNTQGDALLLAENASGNIPSIPSIILTVTQVR